MHRLLLTAATLGTLAASPIAFAQTSPAQPPQSPSADAAPARPLGAQGERFVERFQAANTTHDGKLTLAQAKAGHMPMIARHFAEIDRTAKGYVTLSDIRAYRQAAAAQRRAAQNPPG